MCPCNYEKYPKNWKEISKAVIEKAFNKCELCWAPNGKKIWRNYHTWSHPWSEMPHVYKSVKIVLTVHHINFNTQDNSKYNLIALCQRCHLRLDQANHIKNRRESKEKHQLKLELKD